MSMVAIRAALEVALAAISPAMPTAWENSAYQPVVGTAYQRVYLLPAPPDDIEIGRQGLRLEQGILQVSLAYPLGTGPKAASDRALLIQQTFFRGASFTASGVTVCIERTPEILPGQIDEDRYVLAVRIRFYCHIGG